MMSLDSTLCAVTFLLCWNSPGCINHCLCMVKADVVPLPQGERATLEPKNKVRQNQTITDVIHLRATTCSFLPDARHGITC